MAQDRGKKDREWGMGNGEWGMGSNFLTPDSPLSSQRPPQALFVVSLSLITKRRPALTSAVPDLSVAPGLTLAMANTFLSPRSVTTLPWRLVIPLPVKMK